MNEIRDLALDLAERMADIEAAMKKSPALFHRDTVAAVRDFANQGKLQRGGAIFSRASNAPASQVAEELATSLSRIDNLSNKLRRGRFAHDALLVAGLSIRSATSE